MKKNLIKILTIFCLFIFVISCSRPVCKNTNPIFDKYSPDTKEYKDELVKQLATVDMSRLTYWMDIYREDDSVQKYIQAHVQGDGLCAKIVLVVKGSVKGIEGILRTKGMGYRGAGLKGLKFDIKQNSTSTEFIFQEVSWILD